MSDTTLYNVESVLLATLLVSFALWALLRRLRRARPDFAVGGPVAAGFALRLMTAAGVSATGLGETLRGGDELTFLIKARDLAATGFSTGDWFPGGTYRLHEILFALQIKLADFPEAGLRVTQVGIAMAGIVLIVAAIHDLAGARAARLGAWVLACEPASLFFNGILHREPLLVLASGLVVFGGARVWTKLDLRGVVLLGLGCAIAIGTRPYAGWFLITGALLLMLHAALRQMGTKLRSVPIVYAVAAVVALTTPAVLQLTSQESLRQNLQSSQDANTSLVSSQGDPNTNNLRLERVEFSSRGDLVTNFPQRARDVLLRPYPWQLENTSQRLGAIGTLVMLCALFLLVRYVRRNRGRVLALSAPIVYPALFLLMAYALSVGNAGTGFRYRTHLVVLVIAGVIVLREHVRRRASVTEGDAARGRVLSTGKARPGPPRQRGQLPRPAPQPARVGRP